MVQPSPLPQGWGWQLTPSWAGWLAPVLHAVEAMAKKKKKKRGEVADSGGAWPLSLAASGHPDKTLGQT